MTEVKIRNKSTENVTETELLLARLSTRPVMLACPVCTVSLRPDILYLLVCRSGS